MLVYFKSGKLVCRTLNFTKHANNSFKIADSNLILISILSVIVLFLITVIIASIFGIVYIVKTFFCKKAELRTEPEVKRTEIPTGKSVTNNESVISFMFLTHILILLSILFRLI